MKEGGPIDLERYVLKERKAFTPEQVAQVAKVGVAEVERMIDKLVADGYHFEKSGEVYIRSRGEAPTPLYDATRVFNGRHAKFAIVSDTHLCSKYERSEALQAAYDVAKKEGIHQVFHCGDVTDGVNVYKGHEFEIKAGMNGQEAQIDYAIKHYPKKSGVETIAIEGNHGLRGYEHGGVDPMVQIARARPDIKYLGQYDATVKLADQVKMELIHPRGNQAYALSYRAQREIQNRNVEGLPNILAYGHFHTAYYMHYRAIDFLQVPCFKGEGIFERRSGWNNVVGMWVVEATLFSDMEAVQKFKPELVRFDRLK